MTLPPAVIAALGLPVIGQNHAQLADGTVQILNTFGATAIWEGNNRLIEIDETDAAQLVGMRMMAGYHLRIHVVDGGAVELEKLP